VNDIADRRSLNEIVDDIIAQLQPRKSKSGDLRAGVLVQIEIVRDVAALRDDIGTHAAITKLTQRILNDLTELQSLLAPDDWRRSLGQRTEALIKALPEYRDRPNVTVRPVTEFDEMRTKISAWAHIGHDPRFSNLQHMCVRQAEALVKQHSEKRPSKAQNGNAHLIAQLLFEAVTGRQCRESELLYAVRNSRLS
jgi:hypothetical protein